jgi:hypothetical protein
MVKDVPTRQVCLKGIKGSKKGSEREKAKIMGENNVDCVSYANGIIYHECVGKADCQLSLRG